MDKIELEKYNRARMSLRFVAGILLAHGKPIVIQRQAIEVNDEIDLVVDIDSMRNMITLSAKDNRPAYMPYGVTELQCRQCEHYHHEGQFPGYDPYGQCDALIPDCEVDAGPYNHRTPATLVRCPCHSALDDAARKKLQEERTKAAIKFIQEQLLEDPE